MMILATVTCATTVLGAAVHEIPVGRNPELQFRVDCPAGWALSSDGFDATNYRYVYAALNSTGDPSLHVVAVVETTEIEVLSGLEFGEAPLDSFRTWDLPPAQQEAPADSFTRVTSRMRYGQDHFAEQLPVGTAYVDIAVLHGGPPPPVSWGPYPWREEQAPPAKIAELIESRSPAWESDKVVVYRTYFIRWGREWEVQIVGIKPFAPQRLEEAFEALGTLEFPPLPVVDPDQAAEAVIPVLPAHLLPQADMLEDCGWSFSYAVAIDSLESAFRVEFSVLDGTRERNVVRAKTYLVRRDGVVVDADDR